MLYLTDYNEAKRAALRDSFKTQFKDLRLKDFTPGFVSAQFSSSLLSSTVLNPYIFKVTKGEVSFILLGTFHILPLDVYPDVLIELLASKRCLIVESGAGEVVGASNIEVSNNEFDENEQSSDILIPSAEVEDWFINLPIKFQQFIDVIMYDRLPNCYLYPLDKIKDELSAIAQIGYPGFMDEELYNNGWEEVYSLESWTGHINELNSYTEVDLEKELLKDLNTLEGFVPLDSIVASNKYLSGVYGLKGCDVDEEDKFLEERNIKWVERLKVESSDEVLVAVGCAHLFSNNGLLQLWDNAGWSIERVDLAGEWHAVELTADGLLA